MNHGIILTSGSPLELAGLAAEAEEAGWDGVFTFDAIAIGDQPLFDPWVVMAAFAMRTERVRIGAILTAPSRRRPWKLARETVTLDHLSRGRLVVPVGLGALDDAGFGAVGEVTDTRARAQRLDETLAILEGLWSGEPFGFEGRHYRFPPMRFLPPPVQRPRMPVWVAAAWPRPRSMERAARWDGLLVQVQDAGGQPVEVTPGHVRDVAGWIAQRRAAAGVGSPFDIVVQGTTPADDPAAAAEHVGRWADAGATWWIEADWTSGSLARLRDRVQAGPPSRP